MDPLGKSGFSHKRNNEEILFSGKWPKIQQIQNRCIRDGRLKRHHKLRTANPFFQLLQARLHRLETVSYHIDLGGDHELALPDQLGHTEKKSFPPSVLKIMCPIINVLVTPSGTGVAIPESVATSASILGP